MNLRFVFDFGATKAALLYLASKGLPAFDKYKACKLLFLADREHLLRFGRTISGDSYDALPYGPAPSETLVLLDCIHAAIQDGGESTDIQVSELVQSFALTGAYHTEYRNQIEPDLDSLSESDLLVLDHVAADHGIKTFRQLLDLTNEMAAYKRAWRDDPARKKFPMRFKDFFAEDPEQHELLDEILESQFLTQAQSDGKSIT